MASDRQVAVALKYVQDADAAPRLVAKGRGAVAEQILAIARAHGIPVHRDTDLVEVLAKLNLDDLIPSELYQAVAEILAHLYKMNKIASR